MGNITKTQEKFAIAKAVDRFRTDIVYANPVSFLVRAMNGEEFDGEKMTIRDRVEVAKFLASRIMPVVNAEDMGQGKGVVAPAPLTIILNTGDRKAAPEMVTVETEQVAVN
jgi:hypothetical protein